MTMSIFLLRWITLISVLAWYLIYWQGGLKAAGDILQAFKTPGASLDGWLMALIMLSSLVMAVSALLICLGNTAGYLWESWVVTLVGSVLTLLGIAGTFVCRAYLGKYWTADAAIIDGQRVVDTGPYAIVRHPIYSCAIPLYIGFSLVFLTCWNGLSAVVIVTAYVAKTWEEDRFLDRNLHGYSAYRRSIRYHLLPGVW
jgi:protein-S-isoprenylcysteine O-methyltransferase Ste14